MTLRLYADRKEWKLQAVKVELSHERVHARDCAECEQQSGSRIDLIRRYITVTGVLDAAHSASGSCRLPNAARYIARSQAAQLFSPS